MSCVTFAGKRPVFATSGGTTMYEDGAYFFQDIIFSVEDTLFKVPRHHFEQDSVVFRGMFTLPPPSDRPADGSSKENPLRLDGIRKSEFAAFLQVICPKRFNTPLPKLSWQGWASVLHLSTLWEFEAVKAIAIKSMEPLPGIDPLERFRLSRQYNLAEWYWPALLQLADGPRIASDDPLAKVLEAALVEEMGLDFTFRVAMLQGVMLGIRGIHASAKSSVMGRYKRDHITNLFARELSGVPFEKCSERLKGLCNELAKP